MKKLIAALALVLAVPAWAGLKDTDVDSTGPDFTKHLTVIHIQGQLTADVTGKARFVAPCGMKLLSVKVICRARSGAASDATFDLTATAATVLTAKIAADTAAVAASGTLGATTTFASGTVFAVDWDRNNSGTADDCDMSISWRTKVAAESF